MDYIATHKQIYDSLALEYESRNEKLIEVTKKATDLIATHLRAGNSILELGCGSGLAAKLLHDDGFEVTVTELAPRMIEVARKLVPEITFMEGDFLEVAFAKKFNAIFALAFIHLFPKQDAIKVFKKCHLVLEDAGILYIGTTKEINSSEGWEKKKDYEKQLLRYRKRWTQEEFEQAFTETGFEIVEGDLFPDPFGKVWMDYVVRKI